MVIACDMVLSLQLRQSTFEVSNVRVATQDKECSYAR